MYFSNELLKKAKTAKSAEELLEMTKAENMDLSAEEAAEVFAALNASGGLSDEELDNVVGGWSCENTDKCPKCQSANVELLGAFPKTGVIIYGLKCKDCGETFTKLVY
ncbi:MAG: hypothetical protein ACI4KR_07985 [Ruminiclostridium sp.]